MAEAFIIRGTGGQAPIHLWKRYQVNESHTWTWDKWNTVTTVTYSWNKYNSSIQYTWNRWNTSTQYTWNRWSTITQYTWERWTAQSVRIYYESVTSYETIVRVFEDLWMFGAPWFDKYSGNWIATCVGSCNPGSITYGQYDTGSGYWYAFDTTWNFSRSLKSDLNISGVGAVWGGPMFYKASGSLNVSQNGNFNYIRGTAYARKSNTGTEWRANTFDTWVTSTNASAYPNPGVSGGWWYQNRSSALINGGTSYGTVTAIDNANAYPNPGSDGTYWYEGRTSVLIKGTTWSGTVTSIDNPYAYPNPGTDGTWWYDGMTSAWVKGSISYGTVTAVNNSGAYPANGRWDADGCWYVSAGSTTVYSKGTTYYGQITSTSSEAYPNGGRWDNDGFWYDNRVENVSYSQGSYIDDIMSTDPSKYPQNEMSDSYWYVYSGTI